MKPAVMLSVDGDGIAWITFDDPASRANVFNAAVQAELGGALDALEARDAKAVVVASAKDRIFIAGADLKWLGALADAETAANFARTGQQLFERLARLSLPTVCAIHGACAGGGFELALACHWRVASGAAATQIGLPETGLGSIPGWGGCTRLPRLIGASAALDLILKARLLPATEALKAGLVDEVVAQAELRARAKAAALRLASGGRPARTPPAAPAPDFFSELRRKTLTRTGGHRPALLTAIEVVEAGIGMDFTLALEAEANGFGEVTAGPVCKNMVRAFFLGEAAKKRTLDGWFALEPNAPVPPVRKIGVVGAGVMGSGIAQWAASRGFDVVMRDVKQEWVERGMDVVRGLFDEAAKRGRLSPAAALEGVGRVKGTTGWDGFDLCDLVIEAIVENVAEKQRLFSELAAVVPAGTVLASNTSALPIEEIAGHVPGPERTLGLHFFNPVGRMALLELVLGKATSAEAAERALGFVKALGKSPVVCRSSPGFLVTRVLFFYLNEAVRLWENGAPTEAIDGALREFGWPMGPMRLIDEVGVDVTEFIFGEMEHYFPDRFERSTACAKMLAAGLKGRKNGASSGFYSYAEGREALNPAAAEMRTPGAKRAAADKGWPDHLMRVMIEEAERCLAEGVVRTPEDVDFAMLSGAGFPAFRGGLMHHAKSIAGAGRH